MPAYFLEIAIVVLGLILLLLDAFVSGQRKEWIGWIAIIGLVIVFCLNFVAHGGDESENVFWKYYTYAEGSFAGFYKGIALFATAIVLLMAMDFMPVLRSYTSEKFGAGEFFALPLFTCAGLMWMASARDLITIFVSLELVTISFYVLVAFTRRNVGALEAGVKYLILGALSTAFMVYGITWLFGSTGTTSLVDMETVLNQPGVNGQAVLFGFVLIMVSLGFKIGAVPFQVWVPDVYQGAPAPITAYLTVASKAAAFIVLMRVLAPFIASELVSESVVLMLMLMAAATLIVGNTVAIVQSNMKRLLAYSSIGQGGLILMGIACAPQIAAGTNTIGIANAVSFNLASYALLAMLAFMVVTMVRAQLSGEDMRHYQGLGRRSPFLAFAMVISMAGMAGIPLTSGFFAKFFVFKIAVDAKVWWLLIIAVIGSAAGFYYYFKVIRAMYFTSGHELEEMGELPPLKVCPLARIVMVFLMIGIIAFGVNPSPLMNLEQEEAAPAETPQAAIEQVESGLVAELR